MKRILKLLMFMAAAMPLLMLTACGGGKKENKAVSISISQPPATVMGGRTITLTVTPKNTDVVWPTLPAEQGSYTHTGNAVTYTAPVVSQATLVEFTVTAAADTSKKATARINVVVPSSVGDYGEQEPEMAENRSRATARTGGTTVIGIPDYLQTASGLSIMATATFAVHQDDTSIAEIVSQNGTTATVRGLRLGSARIIITVGSRSATVIIYVTPQQAFYTLPAEEVRRLGAAEFYSAWWNNDMPDELPDDSANYNSEPTHQLAWNWRNYDDPQNQHGASGTGTDSGIDILSYFVDPTAADRRGWVRTTYGFGGWHYDLNGVTNQMHNGVQVNGNVKLELIPEFVYDDGVPYLQIKQVLTNTGSTRLTEQKFGASADVMIFNQDDAPLYYMPYGALMTNGNEHGGITYMPTVKLRLVGQNMQGVSNASTFWFGDYRGERNHVYEDMRVSITPGENRDTALNFSYQGITLNAGESKTFVVRFTQVQ